MNCLLIEKYDSHSIIGEHLKNIPYFNLISHCTSVFDAYKSLKNHVVDIVFIETRLHRISGIEFIKSLDQKPMFVFISDTPELAVDAFSLNALDFLLKPVTFDRFLKTANKAYNTYGLIKAKEKMATKAENKSENTQLNTILVKTDYKTIAIKLHEILYIEGLKDYIKIHTISNNKPIITLNSLKKLEQFLPSNKFSRIHKSYIVSHDHIHSINKSQIIVQDKHIPIGESYRPIITETIKKFSI